VPDEWYDRMAEAAARSGMAAEVSTAGLNKPVGEAYPAADLLARFAAAGVPFTTASDAHRLDRVAEHRDEVRSLLATVGCTSLQAYRSRRPRTVPLG
jgi:histidinol-phosphatase (PHP family)